MQWKITYAHHEKACQKLLFTIEDIESSGFDTMPASVPGCLEKSCCRQESWMTCISAPIHSMPRN